MSDISQIDRNFALSEELGRDDVTFFDVKQTPQYLFGIRYDETGFFRMPHEIAANVNDGVAQLYRHTSGGRLRFVTNSPFVAISCKMPTQSLFSHMPSTGISGFDLYVDGVFQGGFIPPCAPEWTGGYTRLQSVRRDEGKMHEILIHFPLYNPVSELYVGLQTGATIEAAPDYIHKQPVVYYGSSITQGGCVSRPGLAYPAIISRKTGSDFINLGFSGSGKGECIMAEYVASLKPSVFVLDYDHNAPTLEHLKNTHEPFFRVFREACPNTPVVMVTSPDSRWRSNWDGRREVIYETYEHAIREGDTAVSFVDGLSLFGDENFDDCTVDNCHPNDIGHARMAKVIGAAVARYLNKTED